MFSLGTSSWKITKIILTKTMRAVEQGIVIPSVESWRRDSSLRSLARGDDSEHSSQMMIAYSTARDGQIFRVWSGSLVASVVAWRSDDLWRNTAAAALIHLAGGRSSVVLSPRVQRAGGWVSYRDTFTSPLTILGDETILCKYINTRAIVRLFLQGELD